MEIQSVIVSYKITSVSLHMLLKNILKAVADLQVAFQEQSLKVSIACCPQEEPAMKNETSIIKCICITCESCARNGAKYGQKQKLQSRLFWSISNCGHNYFKFCLDLDYFKHLGCLCQQWTSRMYFFFHAQLPFCVIAVTVQNLYKTCLLAGLSRLKLSRRQMNRMS